MESSDTPTLTNLPGMDDDAPDSTPPSSGPPHSAPPDTPNPSSPSPGDSPEPPRRNFLVGFAAVVIGAVAGLVPAVVALMPVVDPLRRKKDDVPFVPVTSLDALPDNGLPRKVTVYKTIKDAWNTVPNARVGAVYLHKHKHGDNVEVVAFNAVCPHAGCFVRSAKDGSYVCPCHDSEFEADGSIRPVNADGRETKSPRDLDTLETKVEKGGTVLVRFQNFRSSIPEKKAL